MTLIRVRCDRCGESSSLPAADDNFIAAEIERLARR